MDELGFPEKVYVVHYPRRTVVNGAICAVFFTVLGIMMAAIEDVQVQWWMLGIFALLALLGVYLVVMGLRWKVQVDVTAETLRVVPVLGKEKTVGFSEITGLSKRHKVFYVHCGDRVLFTFDATCRNSEHLLKTLKRRGHKAEEPGERL